MLRMKTFLILAIFAVLVHADDDNSTDCDIYDVEAEETVKFYLLTPDNQTLELNSTNLDQVNTSLPTKIIIHGLTSFDDSVWIDEMAVNYHAKGNYNVIAIDWSKISTNDSFYVASAVDAVGNVVANFILEITRTNTEHLDRIHLIGSSRGAQVGASAGERVAEKENRKVGRITALDPTEPEDLGVLDKDDAEFVDVIHTTVLVGEKSVGTVDFYVTADDPGTPVCPNDTCGELLGGTYYTKTIVDAQRFMGIPCENASLYIENLCNDTDFVRMGEYVPWNATGNYLVAKDDASSILNRGNLVLSLTAVLVWRYLLY